MKKAFTLIELVVTIALLGMVIFFASIIFRTSIDAHRTSTANAEIMQKLRAITDQLNADFKGFRWPPWFKINFGFGESEIDGQTVNVRSDRVLFFANGDFQSTMLHKHGLDDKTVVGNVAAVFYSLADIPSPPYSSQEKLNPRKKILVRRQTILTADADWSNVVLDEAGEYCNEHDLLSFSELAAEQIAFAFVGDWWNTPDFNDLMSKRQLNPKVEKDLVKYMARGVDDFSIQYVGWDNTGRNFEFNEWQPINEELENNESWWNDNDLGDLDYMPVALKFTFKLYDSKGVIKKGRTFTHIVYLSD